MIFSPGEEFAFRLDPSTTFLAQSAGDMSGVMIQSSRKVAVFTGNVRSYNDYNMTSRDHLVEQVRAGGNSWEIPVHKQCVSISKLAMLTVVD